MGADVEIMNPHQFLIHGPTELKGSIVASQDIRAGAAMLLAALAAKGKTEIANIHYIHRGYQNIEGKLKILGADIEIRIED
jgi:UDP-N-acetylglucosamine 1-carboxyvinyltransferase